MRSVTIVACAGIALMAGGPLAAETSEPAPSSPAQPADAVQPPSSPEAPARFTFNRVDGGFLRIDTVKGQAALCAQRGVGWICEAVPEERAAFDKEVGRLQAEVESLKAEIAAQRWTAGLPRPPAELTPRASENTAPFKMPTDEDIKWARAAIEKVWRQFVDMVAGVQKDLQRKG